MEAKSVEVRSDVRPGWFRNAALLYGVTEQIFHYLNPHSSFTPTTAVEVLTVQTAIKFQWQVEGFQGEIDS